MTNDFETHPIVTDEDADAARRAFHADGCPPWGDASTSVRDGWRRAAEAVRDRLSGREMVAVAQPDTRPNTEDLPGAPLGQPIDPNDLRPGDVFEARERARVDAKGGWTYTGPTYYLLVRQDPDAELIRTIGSVLTRMEGGQWTSESVAILAAIRETHTIEPRPTKSDLHA